MTKGAETMSIRKSVRFLVYILIFVMLAAIPVMLPESSFAASSDSVTATAKVDSKEGAFLRKKASTKSAKVAGLDNNTDLVIMKEVFVTRKKTALTKRWYYVKAGPKQGYIRADLVKNIKYSSSDATLKKKAAGRSGAGKSMKKKATLKKGGKVTVLLKAKACGSSKVWYKVKKGKKRYYVAGSNIKFAKTGSVSETGTATSPAAAAVTEPVSSGPLEFTLDNVSLPETIGRGTPFVLKGTISSTKVITKVKGGITKSSGSWVTAAEIEVNDTVFDISAIDLLIRFGDLANGSYVYKVSAYVDGKWHTQIKKDFKIVEPVKGKKITAKALEVCWPAGTPAKTYKYGKTGSATEAYTAAIEQAYPDRSGWGTAPKKGASCDVFVGTVLRASGVDPDAPRGLDEQIPYYRNSGKYTLLPYTGDRSLLQSGDIVIFKRKAGNTHTCIYLKKDGVEYVAEANYKHTYAYLTSSASTVNSKLKTSDKKYIYIYRRNEG